MNTLIQYVFKDLNTRQIRIFDPRLVSAHAGEHHAIKTIPSKYNLIDALSYIFENDAIPISEVLQGYQDGDGYALDLMEAIEEGISSKSICLRCVKASVRKFFN